MGLFKPAWQSKNELRALGAIGKVSDLSVLAEIAQNAPLARVREVAASRKRVFEQKTQKSDNVESSDSKTFLCPICGAITQGALHKCTNCSWDDSVCPHASGFNTRNQLFEKCSLKTGNNDCSANPYGYLHEDCPIFAACEPYDGSGTKKTTSILDTYRVGLSYLDGCEAFDEIAPQHVVDLRSNAEKKIEQQSGSALDNKEHEAFAQELLLMFKTSKPYDSMEGLKAVTEKYSPAAKKNADEGYNPALKKIYYRVLNLCKTQGVYFHSGTLDSIFEGEYWSS